MRLVVLGKINKIVSCCLFDTHKLQLSTRQSFQRWANLEYSGLASRYWCQLKQWANKSQRINRLQRQFSVLLMAVPSKTCCINTSKQQVQRKCFANNKYLLLKTDTCQKINIWSHQQPETHQVSELWSDNKAKVENLTYQSTWSVRRWGTLRGIHHAKNHFSCPGSLTEKLACHKSSLITPTIPSSPSLSESEESVREGKK